MNALLQIMESLSAHFTTTLSKDFSGLSNGPTAVDDIAAEVCNTILPLLPTMKDACFAQVFAVHMFHSNACRARRVFEKIITLVDRCHVEGGTGSDYGGMKSGGNPFSLATGCWRPVDKVLILITTLREFNWLVWGANVSKCFIGKRLREYHVVKEAFTQSPQNSGLNTAFEICLPRIKCTPFTATSCLF